MQRLFEILTPVYGYTLIARSRQQQKHWLPVSLTTARHLDSPYRSQQTNSLRRKLVLLVRLHGLFLVGSLTRAGMGGLAVPRPKLWLGWVPANSGRVLHDFFNLRAQCP